MMRMKLKYIVWSLFLLQFFAMNVSAKAGSNEAAIDLNNVALNVTYKDKSLLFTVSNNGEKDLLIVDDFCFDSHAQNFLFEEPNLRIRRDNFSNGIVRMQGRMALLKAHGQRTCGIAYFENDEKNVGAVGTGLILWHTNLFVGDIQGSYKSKMFSGVIAVSLPIANKNDPQYEVDEYILSIYKNRNDLGIIKD